MRGSGWSDTEWTSTQRRRLGGFWVWKMRRKMAMRLRRLMAPARSKKYPTPTAAEWREAYEWQRDLRRRVADGSIYNVPPIAEQLADHIERLGVGDFFDTTHTGCRIALTDAILGVVGPRYRLITELADAVEDALPGIREFKRFCAVCGDDNREDA